MKAILLAAGLGTRLAPLTRVLPKCLMPVNGRPLLEYWLRALDAAGVADVLVNTHYRPELVRAFIAASPWAGRVRLVHEPKLLGTGGTLVANRDFFGDEPGLLVHADNLCDAPLDRFLAAHASRPARAAMTMMCFATDAPRTCGILELDRDGIVTAFHEKVADPPGNLANAAVYVVEPEVAAYAAGFGRDEVDCSTEIIPHFLGRILAWPNPGYHRDIGNLASLLAAQTEFAGTVPEPPVAFDAPAPATLAQALAEALDLPLVRLGQPAGDALSGPCLLALPGTGDIDRAAALLRKAAISVTDAVIFLETAPPGFSARRTAERLGLRCLAARQSECAS